ncbi:LysR family transcriptional regulator [Vibrio hippocampi]|uniref:HTH-type transcriptional regulator PgrR n=1 Tax=Vibrio hippocampi TaxID=654686 RepID=A0ABM8ZM40_9VIBR|nr:LysR family transcriptional regulator [Vibrio hippocampi]CAH0529528.1 HTH-type transcriptional regulator PgrR [Vibrio hippocampi]
MPNSDIRKGGAIKQSSAIDPQQLVRMLFFIELINAGSITKAAEALNISTSTGSRWLSDLEAELGITLYQRNNPQERLTEAGSFLYSKFSEITDDIHLMINELTGFTTETRGNIKICCTPIYADKVVLPIIGEFVEQHARVNVQFTLTPRGMDYYKDHDFIITAIAGHASNKDSELLLVRRTLLTQKFITVATPAYVKKHGEPLVPKDLINHRCLYSKALQNDNQWVYKQNGTTIPIQIVKSIEVSDAKMMLNGALNSMGVTYLPEFVVSKYLEEGKLISLLNEYETDDWLVNIYYLPQRFMTHCVKSFKDFFLLSHRDKINQFMGSSRVNSERLD